MKQFGEISKEWAQSVLTNGYEPDKKDPMTTKAKVWDKEKKEMVEVVINVGDKPMGKCSWRGDMLK